MADVGERAGAGAGGFEAMLMRMGAVVADEFAGFEEGLAAERLKAGGGLGAKGRLDVISAMTKTLEKIEQLLRQAAAEREAARKADEADRWGADEREELAERVAVRIEGLIDERARALAARRIAPLAAALGEGCAGRAQPRRADRL